MSARAVPPSFDFPAREPSAGDRRADERAGAARVIVGDGRADDEPEAPPAPVSGTDARRGRER